MYIDLDDMYLIMTLICNLHLDFNVHGHIVTLSLSGNTDWIFGIKVARKIMISQGTKS